jgi:hypothetical protein
MILMAMIEINWSPGNKELRNFGRIALIALLIITLLFYWKGLALDWALIIFAAGVVIFIVSLISLQLTRIIYLGLTLVTLPIGLVISHVLLAVLYFLLITPMGLLFRLIGRDLMHRKFDVDTKSYWHPRDTPKDIERYFRQF